MFWTIVNIIELVIVFLAFLANILFSYMIHSAKNLQFCCRCLLQLFSFSMFLLTISHAYTIINFLVLDTTYDKLYLFTDHVRYGRMFHEFGYCLQSLSLLMFSADRLVAGTFIRFYLSMKFKLLIVFCSILSILISLAFTISIHVYLFTIAPTFFMDFIDFFGIILICLAWKVSIRTYKSTIGSIPLEERYQLSEVYHWSKTLIPGVILASIAKVISIISIWSLLGGGELKENEAGYFLFIYNNSLNIYSIILPFVIFFRHKTLRLKLLHRRSSFALTTLEGNPIDLKISLNDYFKNLGKFWNS